jgi:HPt (histidine-containing phosphotransfer) domain-containing protein
MSQPASQPLLRSEFANDPDMIELVQEFVQDLPTRAETLTKHLQASEYSDLRRVAHQIKGAAGGYGFAPISVSAGKVEKLLQSELNQANLQDLRDQVAELVGLCRRASAT